MPGEINGLPAHVLLVHAVVVLIPLCAALLVASAVLPSVLRRLGAGLPVLAAVCLALVPLTVHAGEWLEERVGGGELVERHADLGEGILPWAIGLFVLSLVVWWRGRVAPVEPVPELAGSAVTGSGVAGGASGEARPGLLVHVGIAVLCAVVAAGAVVQVVRTGESGAKAVWSGVVESS